MLGGINNYENLYILNCDDVSILNFVDNATNVTNAFPGQLLI